MFQENARQQKETERFLKELGAETDRRIGRLGNRLGDVIENLMSPKLHEKFEELGFSFTHGSRNHELKDRNKQRLTEIDVLLETGEYALAEEAKTHLKTEDVQDHIKRMGILRRAADKHKDNRKYLGAVAGAIIDQEASDYAVKNGFYAIIPSGDTVDIEVPAGFKPRLWQAGEGGK
jgi:hypothetical protein